MSNDNPSIATRFKPGPDSRRYSAVGRPRFDSIVRGWLDEKTQPALEKLWAMTDHEDPFIALPALVAFLKKCIPDLKPAEQAKAKAAVSEAGDVTVAAAERLANLHKKLEAQVEALGREPH